MIRFLAGVIAAILLTLVGCAPAPEPGPEVRYVLGVSQANTTEPWRLSVIADIQKEAAGFPGLRVVVTDASDSVEKQSQDLDRLLGLGCDLLIVSPADSAGLRAAVDRAYQKVPVIVIDRAVEGYNYSLYLGPDNRRIGREAGRYVASLLGKGGRVLEVLGRHDSPPSLDRSLGFREGLADRPDIVLVPGIEADWLQDKAEDVLTPFFSSGQRVDVVFAQNDAMAYGAWLALRRSGVQGVPILGIDGLGGPTGGLSLVRNGTLAATFNVPTGGREAVGYAIDILDKAPGIPKKIILRTSIVSRETPKLPEFANPLPSGPGSNPGWGSANWAVKAFGGRPIVSPSKRLRPSLASSCSLTKATKPRDGRSKPSDGSSAKGWTSSPSRPTWRRGGTKCSPRRRPRGFP